VADDPVPADQCTEEQARALTRAILQGVEHVHHLIREAFDRGAWRALNYPSWEKYCEAELGTGRFQVPREIRQQAVAELTSGPEPMSDRAVAAGLGVSHTTVARDRGATGTHVPVESATYMQQPSRKIAAVRAWQAKSAEEDARGAAAEPEPVTPPSPSRLVRSADGKTRRTPVREACPTQTVLPPREIPYDAAALRLNRVQNLASTLREQVEELEHVIEEGRRQQAPATVTRWSDQVKEAWRNVAAAQTALLDLATVLDAGQATDKAT
jgi:hypothetical protein